MDFVTAYGPKLRVFARSADDGRTKQAFREESEIKNIIARFQRTGLLEYQNEHSGSYGVFEAMDFHEAMNVVARASEMFEDLPSGLRKKLGNDPAEFVDVVTNPARRDEAIALGLVKEARKEPGAPGAPPETPPAAPPAAPAA